MTRPESRAAVGAWRPAFGAHPEGDGARFSVWAPEARALDVLVDPPSAAAGIHALTRGPDGAFAGVVSGVAAGDRYRYRLDGAGPYPDPASRCQPDGVHGPSEVIDPDTFTWTDAAWRGRPGGPLVLYELHVGTFTPEGTFAAAAGRLPWLRDLGVTAVELMPVADFPGRRNWGYDGVCLYAPARCYGRPDDLRRLVDTAHRLGVAVHLDVVYNHLGPDGAYPGAFSPAFFTDRHESPWGAAINLDGPGSAQVRQFLIDNALYWIEEFHVDGLRLDATHALQDDSSRHFVAELAARAHGTPGGRRAHVVAEDHRNLAVMLRGADEGGWDLDGVWADDFHHQVRRLLAGDAEGYYSDFTGTTRDLAATIRQGWFFTGQRSRHLKASRGTDPSGVPPHKFVFCIQNHDQVGNRAMGDRLTAGVPLDAYRAASALLLAVPQTPLLFMGQEWAAATPFQYFTDHHDELGRLVTEGRRREFGHFTAFSDPSARARIPDPQAEATFEASRLDWREPDAEPHAGVLRLYRALLALRRDEPALGRHEGPTVDAVDLDEDALLVRRRAAGAREMAVVVRLRGAGRHDLAPWLEGGRTWEVALTTEEPAFSADAQPPLVDVSGPAPVIAFRRPAAVFLRRRPA